MLAAVCPADAQDVLVGAALEYGDIDRPVEGPGPIADGRDCSDSAATVTAGVRQDGASRFGIRADLAVGLMIEGNDSGIDNFARLRARVEHKSGRVWIFATAGGTVANGEFAAGNDDPDRPDTVSLGAGYDMTARFRVEMGVLRDEVSDEADGGKGTVTHDDDTSALRLGVTFDFRNRRSLHAVGGHRRIRRGTGHPCRRRAGAQPCPARRVGGRSGRAAGGGRRRLCDDGRDPAPPVRGGGRTAPRSSDW